MRVCDPVMQEKRYVRNDRRIGLRRRQTCMAVLTASTGTAIARSAAAAAVPATIAEPNGEEKAADRATRSSARSRAAALK